jgi:hypothetical protein
MKRRNVLRALGATTATGAASFQVKRVTAKSDDYAELPRSDFKVSNNGDRSRTLELTVFDQGSNKNKIFSKMISVQGLNSGKSPNLTSVRFRGRIQYDSILPGDYTFEIKTKDGQTAVEIVSLGKYGFPADELISIHFSEENEMNSVHLY